MHSPRLLCPLGALLAMTAVSLAALPAQAAATISGASLGEYVSGPKLTAQQLKGRGVVFEYWGVNCPPCKASIPHIAELQAKYANVVFIANQCQGGGVPNALKVWNEHKGGKGIAVINGGELPGSDVNSIPRVFVFDHLGKLVFDKNPLDPKFASAVATVSKAAPGAEEAQKMADAMDKAKEIFGDNIPDELSMLAMKLAMPARASAPPLAMLARAAKAKDKTIAEAAAGMIAAFAEHVAKQGEKVDALAEESPAAGYALAEELAKWAPQLDAGAAAKKKLAQWDKDKAFTKERKADELFLSLKADAEKIDFEKHEKAVASYKMTENYKKLKKDYAGTKGLQKAEDAAEKWKLETGKK